MLALYVQYIDCPSVNNSMYSAIVHMVAFVNLLLKKMMMMMMSLWNTITTAFDFRLTFQFFWNYCKCGESLQTEHWEVIGTEHISGIQPLLSCDQRCQSNASLA